MNEMSSLSPGVREEEGSGQILRIWWLPSAVAGIERFPSLQRFSFPTIGESLWDMISISSLILQSLRIITRMIVPWGLCLCKGFYVSPCSNIYMPHWFWCTGLVMLLQGGEGLFLLLLGQGDEVHSYLFILHLASLQAPPSRNLWPPGHRNLFARRTGSFGPEAVMPSPALPGSSPTCHSYGCVPTRARICDWTALEQDLVHPTVVGFLVLGVFFCIAVDLPACIHRGLEAREMPFIAGQHICTSFLPQGSFEAVNPILTLCRQVNPTQGTLYCYRS